MKKKSLLLVLLAVLLCGLSAQAGTYTVGSPEIRYRETDIFNNSGWYNACFTLSNGCTVKEGLKKAIKFTQNTDATKEVYFCFGTGYKERGSDESFGITDENKDYSSISFDIKLGNAASYDNVRINFGYTPKSDLYADFQYYGRKLEYSFNIKDYLSESTDWQRVEIPLKKLEAYRTNTFCIPGTDSWTYEKIDWSNINLIIVGFDKYNEGADCQVKNVIFSIAERANCTAQYTVIKPDGAGVSSVSDAAGNMISCSIELSNEKSVTEKFSVAALLYKDGKLVNAAVKSVTAPGGEAVATVEELFSIPEDTDGLTLRIFPITEDSGIHILDMQVI